MEPGAVDDFTDLSCTDDLQSAVDDDPSQEGLNAMKELLRDNPYCSLVKEWDCHYYPKRQQAQGHQKKKKQRVDNDGNNNEPQSEEEAIEGLIDHRDAIETWIQRAQGEVPCCFDFRLCKYSTQRCFCLRQVDTSCLVDCAMFVGKQEKGTRSTLYKQFVQASSSAKKVIIRLPSINNNRGMVLCVNSFRNLFAIRDKAYNKLRTELKAGNPGPNRTRYEENTNRQKNSMKMKCKDDVVSWLNEFAQQNGEPMATRFVRELTGVGIRDDEIDLLHLPSHMSKRGIYCGYVYHNGWCLIRPTHKGSYGNVANYKKRSDDPDDNEWPDDVEPNPVCSYTVFRELWDKYCPKIVIRPPSEDVCGECYVYKNRIKFGARGETLSVTNPQTEDREDAQSVDSSNVNNKDHEEAQEQMMVFVGDDDDENESDENYVRDEEIILAAARHVTSAREMRRSIKDRQETSQQLKSNNVEHSDMCYMIIIDYAQNMDVPHFGGEQPGETYYYSPKNVFVFGVCDVTVNPIQMHAYCYEEETGKKGGNNVASLIMLHLERQGILKKKEGTNEPMTGNKLTIACNNCAGQNKNNMVVRLAAYLVEKGHFQEVEFLLYVKGHTKIACDRSFNQVKSIQNLKNT